jgi:cell wall-associated NlpC family hydrolase
MRGTPLRGRFAIRGRHRRRSIGHHPGVKRALLVLGAALALAACATAPRSKPTGISPPGPDPRQQIIASATAMIGQPYRWGGAEPGGFDCSGLVEYATNSAGLHLPRTAREQMGAGVPVARSDVQAGDLVFMHLERKELHVGIALDKGRFVHAPSRGGRVRIDSLNANPYARAFIKARRVIDSEGSSIGG